MGLKLNSSSGSITLEAQNTAGDTTVTIPSSTGTVLMSDGDGSSLTGIDTGANAALSNLSGVAGTSGQVMTSDGSGNATMQDAAGGGAWTLINTVVASNDATLTITGLDSTYDTYAIAFSDMRPADLNGGQVKLRLGDSGGIDSGASDYAYHVGKLEAGGTGYSARVSTGTDAIELRDSSGGDTGEGWGGMLYLHQPSDGTSYPIITGTMSQIDSVGQYKGGAIHAFRTAVISTDRVQVFQGTGNISAGRMTVWGIKHT